MSELIVVGADQIVGFERGGVCSHRHSKSRIRMDFAPGWHGIGGNGMQNWMSDLILHCVPTVPPATENRFA